MTHIEKAARLIAVLQRDDHATAQQLSAEAGIDASAIYRWCKALQRQGLVSMEFKPASRGHVYAWRWKQ